MIYSMYLLYKEPNLVLLNVRAKGTEDYFDTLTNTRFTRHGKSGEWLANKDGDYYRSTIGSYSNSPVQGVELLDIARNKLLEKTLHELLLSNKSFIAKIKYLKYLLGCTDIVWIIVNNMINWTEFPNHPLVDRRRILDLKPALDTSKWRYVVIPADNCSYYVNIYLDGEYKNARRVRSYIKDPKYRGENYEVVWYIGYGSDYRAASFVVSRILDIRHEDHQTQ